MAVIFDLEFALKSVGFDVITYDGVKQVKGVIVPGYGEVSMQLHRRFNGNADNEMCVLLHNDPHMDVLFMGTEPSDFNEFALLLKLLFPNTAFSDCARKLCFQYSFDEFDDICKYLKYKDDFYVPIIYKHEYVVNDRSIWLMFAKNNQISFSRKKVLFHVKAGTLRSGLAEFLSLYHEKFRDKSIRGKEWFGSEPYEIDFMND